jgi:hypothetical protein
VVEGVGADLLDGAAAPPDLLCPVWHGISVFLSRRLRCEIERVATCAGMIHGGRLLFRGRLAELQWLTAKEAQVVCAVDGPDAAAAVLAAPGWSVRPVPERPRRSPPRARRWRAALPRPSGPVSWSTA